MKSRLDILAVLIVTVLALAGIIVLAVLQLPTPEVLALVLSAGAGALGMAASPIARSSTDAQNVPTPADEPRHLVRADTGKALHPRGAK
jgi:hypothetical protein